MSELKIGVLYIHTTYLDNINNLDESFLKEAETTKLYDPIKFQRDFLGKWINEDEHALLSKELLDLALEKVEVPNEFNSVVVAIDPAVTTNKNSDNTGLAVCAKKGKEYYVLHVEEGKYTPNEWARRAKELYIKYNADLIVYEGNQGRRFS